MDKRGYPERHGTLGSLLRPPWRALESRVYAGLVERGFPDIRPAHGAVFRYIAEEGSRVSDLADRAGMTKQSMAYLVAYLEEHGYVTLVPDARDGRAKLARVTDRGAAVQAAAAALSREVEGEWAHALGGESMAALRDGLRRLCDHLEDTAGRDPHQS